MLVIENLNHFEGLSSDKMKLSKPVTGGLNKLLIADYPRFSFHFLIKFFTVEELNNRL
jgi:hypothetical protein